MRVQPGVDEADRIARERLPEGDLVESPAGQRGQVVGAAAQCPDELPEEKECVRLPREAHPPREIEPLLRVVLDIGEDVAGGQTVEAEHVPANGGAEDVAMLDSRADPLASRVCGGAEIAAPDVLRHENADKSAVGDESMAIDEPERNVCEPTGFGMAPRDVELEAVRG